MGLYGQMLSTNGVQASMPLRGSVEVEIKIRINEEDKEKVLQRLSSSKFVIEVEQRERYLNNPLKSFFFRNSLGFLDANEYLRVRESQVFHPVTDDALQTFLSFKRVHRDEKGNYLYCDEYDTRVSNSEQTLRLLQNLGFTDTYMVHKKRKVYAYGNYSVSIDELPKLGCFIEVELLTIKRLPKEELEGIRAFIVNILGVTEFEEQTHGYLSMVINPHFDFSKKRLMCSLK